MLAFAAERPGKVEVCAAKPGLITSPARPVQAVLATVLKWVGVVPKVSLSEIAAAMLDQVINGFEKEPLENDDLARIGSRVLSSAP